MKFFSLQWAAPDKRVLRDRKEVLSDVSKSILDQQHYPQHKKFHVRVQSMMSWVDGQVIKWPDDVHNWSLLRMQKFLLDYFLGGYVEDRDSENTIYFLALTVCGIFHENCQEKPESIRTLITAADEKKEPIKTMLRRMTIDVLYKFIGIQMHGE